MRARWLLAPVAAAAVAHALPAVMAWPAVRRAVSPPLCGLGEPGRVALTFDDGPHRSSTPAFLRVLDRYGIRATFFMLGSQVRRAPGLAAEIAAAGHEVAVHGYSHRCLLAVTPRQTGIDIARAVEVIGAATGTRPTWWRPPYGVLTGAGMYAAKRNGLRPVLWTAWGRDWTARATADSVYRMVGHSLTGGGTILLHDSDITAAPGCWQAGVAALPRVLDRCAELGLSVGPLTSHGVRAL